jgi:hypothetical protein
MTQSIRTPHPTQLRLRRFWSEALAARATADEASLMQAARDIGLVAEVHKLSRHGEEDVRHVIQWALLGRSPW